MGCGEAAVASEMAQGINQCDFDDSDERIPMVRVGARWRRFVDGGGQVSPGRFLPEDRIKPPLGWLAEILREEVKSRGLVVIFQTAARRTDDGNPFENPFCDDDICAIRRRIFVEVASRDGISLESLSEVAPGQPWYLNFLAALGRLTGGIELDHEYPLDLADGVPLGVDEELPRNPNLFAAKTKYRLSYSDSEPHDCGGVNAVSTHGHEDFVDEKLEEDVRLGFRTRLQSDTELHDFLGGPPCRGKLSVAIRERDGITEKRLVYNNTANGGNGRIRVKDLIEQPGLADLRVPLKRSQRYSVDKPRRQKKYAYLKFDYSKAHNRFKVQPKDWKYQVATWRGQH